MDKFINKQKRKEDGSAPISPVKGPRQRTIESLKGVVVIEDIKRYKTILDMPDQKKENIMLALTELSKKIPPRHVLISTNIGKSVRKLRKYEDEEVSKLSQKICKDWNDFFVKHENQGFIEVQCDLKTERLRKKAKEFLANAMSLSDTHIVVEHLEREIYHQCKRLTGNTYKKTSRTFVFKLKNNPDLRKEFTSCTADVKRLVKESLKKS